MRKPKNQNTKQHLKTVRDDEESEELKEFCS